jgi:hypothetical protein
MHHKNCCQTSQRVKKAVFAGKAAYFLLPITFLSYIYSVNPRLGLFEPTNAGLFVIQVVVRVLLEATYTAIHVITTRAFLFKR